MSAKHKKLVEKAREAIQAVFGDAKVSQGVILESLQELETDIGAMIMTLEDPDDFSEDDEI